VRLAFASYLDAIAEEADRLDSLLAADLDRAANLDKKVPACPNWTARELLGHVAATLEFWAEQVAAGDPEEMTETVEECDPEAVAANADRLVAELRTAGPEAPCWNWSGEELTTAWVARQLAIETAVHRVDGEQSQGRPLPVELELAIDGIEQRIAVHLASDLGEGSSASLGGTVCLICEDAPAAFVVEVERGRLRWRHGRGPADVVLVGAASELFLYTWNRLPPEALKRTGDLSVAEAWRKLPST